MWHSEKPYGHKEAKGSHAAKGPMKVKGPIEGKVPAEVNFKPGVGQKFFTCSHRSTSSTFKMMAPPLNAIY